VVLEQPAVEQPTEHQEQLVAVQPPAEQLALMQPRVVQ
jgi:hypothetical protein